MKSKKTNPPEGNDQAITISAIMGMKPARDSGKSLAEENPELFLYARQPEVLYLSMARKEVLLYEGFGPYFGNKVIRVKGFVRSILQSRPKRDVKGATKAIELKNGKFTGLTFVGVKNELQDHVPCVMIPDVGVVKVSGLFLTYALMNGLMGEDCALKGEYTFVKFNGSVDLVHVESEIYKRALQVEDKFTKKQLKAKNFDFEVGCCYRAPTGRIGLFLGYMSTISFIVGLDNHHELSKRDVDFKLHSLSAGTEPTTIFDIPYPYDEVKFHIKKNPMNIVGLWLDIGESNSFFVQNILYAKGKINDGSTAKHLMTALENNLEGITLSSPKYSSFQLKRRTTYIEKCENLPKIEIASTFVEDFKLGMKRNFEFRLKSNLDLEGDHFFNARLAALYAPFINMNYIGFTKTHDPMFDYLEHKMVKTK